MPGAVSGCCSKHVVLEGQACVPVILFCSMDSVVTVGLIPRLLSFLIVA